MEMRKNKQKQNEHKNKIPIVARATWAALSAASTAESRALVLFFSVDQAELSNLSTDSSTILRISEL